MRRIALPVLLALALASWSPPAGAVCSLPVPWLFQPGKGIPAQHFNENFAVLAGCIDDINTGIIAAAPAQRRFLIVGDSRYRRSSDAAGSLNPGWYAGGPWTWFRTMAGQRAQIYVTDNFAKGGTTIHDAITDPAMVPAALAASKPGDVLVFNSGTNTFVAANTPFGQAVVNDINTLLAMCRARSVLLVLVLPAARDTWANTDQYNSFTAYRRWAIEWGRVKGVKIVDLFAVSSDPNAASPSYSRDWWTVDGLHQSILGSIREAQLYMREFADLMPPEELPPTVAYRLDIAPGTTTYPNPYGALVDGGMLPGTGGTISASCPICSGDVAGSWTMSYAGTSTLTGSVTLSKITLPDGSAAQRIVFTDIAGGTNREPYTVFKFQSNAAQRWKVGDRIEGQAIISASGTPRSVNYELVYNRGDGELTLTDAQKNLPDPGNVVVLNAPYNSGATWTLTVVPGAGAPGACNGGVGIAFPYTLAPGDGTAEISAAWAAAINADATLSACGYSAVAAAVPPNPGIAVAIHSPYRENQSATFASTNGGSITALGGPGQYGNMPGDPVISGVWNTDRMTLPAETAVDASTLRESIIVWIDASDPTGARGNATIDISRITAMIAPNPTTYP